MKPVLQGHRIADALQCHNGWFFSSRIGYHILSEFVKRLLTKIDNCLSVTLGVYAIIPQMRHIQCPSAYVVKPRGGKVWLYYYCLRLTDAVAVISAELSAVVSAVERDHSRLKGFVKVFPRHDR